MFSIKSYGLDMLLYLCNHLIAYIPSHTIRRFFLLNVMKVELGEGSSVHMGLRLYTRGQIKLGKHTVIDRDCVLDSRGHLTIGDNVNLAPEVMILTAYHDPDSADFCAVYKPVVIEDYAWVATRALILPGVTIGRAAVVGAGSVVTKDVEPGTIVAGNPAKPIRKRQGAQHYKLQYTRLFH
jgi:acetyltransferase-like isoleucine patch superfamily enzyme